MKKLALEVDSLSVETFATWPGAAVTRGTVRGREAPTLLYPRCGTNSVCFTFPTGCPCTPRAGEG